VDWLIGAGYGLRVTSCGARAEGISYIVCCMSQEELRGNRRWLWSCLVVAAGAKIASEWVNA
jgi:hypothetical protein